MSPSSLEEAARVICSLLLAHHERFGPSRGLVPVRITFTGERGRKIGREIGRERNTEREKTVRIAEDSLIIPSS